METVPGSYLSSKPDELKGLGVGATSGLSGPAVPRTYTVDYCRCGTRGSSATRKCCDPWHRDPHPGAFELRRSSTRLPRRAEVLAHVAGYWPTICHVAKQTPADARTHARPADCSGGYQVGGDRGPAEGIGSRSSRAHRLPCAAPKGRSSNRHVHRPHPRPEARRDTVRNIVDFVSRIGGDE